MMLRPNLLMPAILVRVPITVNKKPTPDMIRSPGWQVMVAERELDTAISGGRSRGSPDLPDDGNREVTPFVALHGCLLLRSLACRPWYFQPPPFAAERPSLGVLATGDSGFDSSLPSLLVSGLYFAASTQGDQGECRTVRLSLPGIWVELSAQVPNNETGPSVRGRFVFAFM